MNLSAMRRGSFKSNHQRSMYNLKWITSKGRPTITNISLKWKIKIDNCYQPRIKIKRIQSERRSTENDTPSCLNSVNGMSNARPCSRTDLWKADSAWLSEFFANFRKAGETHWPASSTTACAVFSEAAQDASATKMKIEKFNRNNIVNCTRHPGSMCKMNLSNQTFSTESPRILPIVLISQSHRWIQRPS